MNFAPAAMAQSTNLLSSGSSVISPNLNVGFTNNVYLQLSITSITNEANRALVFRSSTSSYSSNISLVMQRMLFPARTDLHIPWYGLCRETTCTNELVSKTIRLFISLHGNRHGAIHSGAYCQGCLLPIVGRPLCQGDLGNAGSAHPAPQWHIFHCYVGRIVSTDAVAWGLAWSLSYILCVIVVSFLTHSRRSPH